MISITLPDANDFVIGVTLDNAAYFLHFSWNDTAGYWKFAVLDEKKNMILQNVKCVPNYPLLAQHRISALPQGEFLCITNNSTIGRNDFFESKAYFIYVPEDELDGAV